MSGNLSKYFLRLFLISSFSHQIFPFFLHKDYSVYVLEPPFSAVGKLIKFWNFYTTFHTLFLLLFFSPLLFYSFFRSLSFSLWLQPPLGPSPVCLSVSCNCFTPSRTFEFWNKNGFSGYFPLAVLASFFFLVQLPSGTCFPMFISLPPDSQRILLASPYTPVRPHWASINLSRHYFPLSISRSFW